jgi:hypothetical protein
MRMSTLCLLACLTLACSACASAQKLKTPCSLSTLSSSLVSGDCGPLRLVNEAAFYLFNS